MFLRSRVFCEFFSRNWRGKGGIEGKLERSQNGRWFTRPNAIKSIRWQISYFRKWKIRGRLKREGNLFARLISLLTPSLLFEPLLTLVGKYFRGPPVEKLGKYPGNSITKWFEFNFFEISGIPISALYTFQLMGLKNVYGILLFHVVLYDDSMLRISI